MQAFWFEQFGQAAAVLEQGDRPMPQPAAGEVLVRMHTTAVNPSDVKKRAGAFPDLLDTGPVIPHSDGVLGSLKLSVMAYPRPVWVIGFLFIRHSMVAQVVLLHSGSALTVTAHRPCQTALLLRLVPVSVFL